MEKNNAYFKYFISLFTIIVYIVLFYFLYLFIGNSYMIFSIIPVIIATWYFTFRFGIIVQILLIMHRFVAFKFLGVEIENLLIPSVFIGTGVNLLLIYGLYWLKRLIHKMENAESKYRTLLESIEEGVGNVDENENFLYVNQAAADIFGYSKDEMQGKNVKELTTSEMYQEVLKETSLRKKGDSSRYELTMLRKNGEQRTIRITATPIIGKDGTYLGAFAIFHDITERKKAEQKIKESELKYRSLFENMTDIVCMLDKKGIITDINSAGIDLFEYTKDELLNTNITQIIHPGDIKKSKAFFIKLNKNGFFKMYEGRIITKSGKIIWVQVNSTEYLKDGIKVGSQDIIRDFTEQKEAEQKIFQQNKILKELNATKDKFFSIIAHDLKNPFNTMLNFSKLLIEKFEEYEVIKQKQFINIIYQDLQNTYKLLEDLLLWSHTLRGSIDYKPQKENLYLLSNETIMFLGQSAANKSINLINEIPENIYVKADKNMFLTIIRNIISNAIKFTLKGGEISIKAHTILVENNQKFVEITVKDNGVGIEQKRQTKLFDITENITTKGTEKEKGTGLGLILCREFVENHSGKIWVESEEGKGSEFKFTIPLLTEEKIN